MTPSANTSDILFMDPVLAGYYTVGARLQLSATTACTNTTISTILNGMTIGSQAIGPLCNCTTQNITFDLILDRQSFSFHYGKINTLVIEGADLAWTNLTLDLYTSNAFCPDTDPPTVSVCPSPVTLNTQPSSCSVLMPDLTVLADAQSDCGKVFINQSIASDSVLSPGNYSVRIGFADAYGLNTNCDTQVTVTDTTFPDVTCTPNITLEVDWFCQVRIPSLIPLSSISDNCGIAQMMQYPAADSVRTRGNFSVILMVCDHSHNVANCESIVNMVDTIMPTITCPPPIVLNASETCQTSFPDFMALSNASDNCGFTLSQYPTVGTPLGLGEFLVTVRATDFDGNYQECTTSVTVLDKSAPTIPSCAPARVYQKTQCDGDLIELPSFMVTGLELATDNCNLTEVIQNPLPGTKVSLGIYNVSLTFVDASNNQMVCTTEFRFEDSESKASSVMTKGAVAGAAVGATAGAGIGLGMFVYFAWDHLKEFFNFKLPAPEIPQPTLNFNNEMVLG
eukprot:CAMPEP_0168575450 /NCGR_PEP_ID=MMETSP0413-20121227/19677_1 /TAXON_ID=136452 /ORGANISM="Filamoeba nolandi, Strain NC-AS-23-1" /LENGTH=508 /DNA_ID=CAMNT_0008608973 /DNA_START=154 /DNA_END=1676 /DNA_ORIENTATION=+